MREKNLPMPTRNRIKVPERAVALMWQQLLGREPVTEGGERVKEIYPGRVNSNNGPDFQDAVVAIGRTNLLKGDVEIHVKSSDWQSHGHCGDPGYNNVILHVVLWHDCEEAISGQNGEIPVLCLSKALKYQPHLLPYKYPPCFCMLGSMEEQALGNLLNVAGMERFKQKAALFRLGLQREEASQRLFQSMMRALGYSRNSKPFGELAQRVPLGFLERMGPEEGLILKQAWLLGVAGLLPSQRLRGIPPGEWGQELERVWQMSGKGVRTMSESDWNFSHI